MYILLIHKRDELIKMSIPSSLMVRSRIIMVVNLCMRMRERENDRLMIDLTGNAGIIRRWYCTM